jgi:hypothetical protein
MCRLLIPITILITAFLICLLPVNQIKRKCKSDFRHCSLELYGLGFSNYFKAILGGNATSKLLLAECVKLTAPIVMKRGFVFFDSGVYCTNGFRFSKRDW